MIASENAYDRIEIVERVEETTRYGREFTGDYRTLFPIACREIYISGREKEINDQLTALRRVEFKIRYTRKISEDMLIKYNDELYDVKSIKHHKRKDTYVRAERAKE